MSPSSLAVLFTFVISSATVTQACDVIATIETGQICGVKRLSESGSVYASFRGVPYAKQPLGELRFTELQPAESWNDVFNATTEGPSCPQTDRIFGNLRKPQNMSESCIHANVHVPMEYFIDLSNEDNATNPGLPIIVFMHGGAFQSGSGDSDIYGPEYVMSQNSSILITFNTRIDVFGYLSLNSSTVPGNTGLRDAITFLKWVQRNVRVFGGNPNDVTFVGQSSGSTCVHLLSLSSAAEGLFHKAVLMSGTAHNTFYSSSPAYAQVVTNLLTTTLGINTTDVDEIHSQLVAMPLEKIMAANAIVQDASGLSAFVPVVESVFEGVTPIIASDPEQLISDGKGKDIPFIIGFTTSECYSLQSRIKELNITTTIASNPAALAPTGLLYTLSNETLLAIGDKIQARYFNDSDITLDVYLPCCSDTYFKYPALRLAKIRAGLDGAPTYLYQFTYEGEYNVLKEVLDISYNGTTHLEDLTYVFRMNSALNSTVDYHVGDDDQMRQWMTSVFTNFSSCGNPTCGAGGSSAWPPVNTTALMYQDLRTPGAYSTAALSQELSDMVTFFDTVWSTTD